MYKALYSKDQHKATTEIILTNVFLFTQSYKVSQKVLVYFEDTALANTGWMHTGTMTD